MKKQVMIIPALDFQDISKLEVLIRETGKHPFIYGYKLGFSLGLTYGLPKAVEIIRKYSDKPVIYDHQKAGTDIPDTGELYASVMSKSGINEVIIFPQAGPLTEKSWIEAIKAESLKVIVGGVMTHKSYLESEGGFIKDSAVEKMYSSAVESGVTSFVVPLTKGEIVENLIKKVQFPSNSEFYSPGFGKQGGNPADFPSIKKHYLIVGRSLLESKEPVQWLEKTKRELQEIL
ncbi:MAG: orotidine 5'-phosphate decarboxylase [Candidatus Riflebacteria bacterium]|nr:orotidine 5'-phosphate decarboxylase [Candidatus Riflebacteria bacterium]